MEWGHRQLLWLDRRCQVYLGCHGNGAALRGRETAALQPSQGLKLLHGALRDRRRHLSTGFICMAHT